MKRPTTAEVLYSLKCFLASMLALYLASSMGLPRPFWAMMTAYIVANPHSGEVRSKAVYRVCGTIVGSAATVLLVPLLVDAPALLSLALACWVGACLYFSLQDRTPRSYVSMLAGYTAALIGFSVVTDPASVFDVALARVEEISLGILCATLVHSLVFPQSLGPVLMARVDRAIGDARQWIDDVMSANDSDRGERARRTLAGDITALRLMSTHLPFDTSHLRWTSNTLHSIQDQLALIMPSLSAVEDRLEALEQTNRADLTPGWNALMRAIAQWVRDGKSANPERAMEFREALARLTPALGASASWSEILQLNLATRLRALIDAYTGCMEFRRHLDAVLHGVLPSAQERKISQSLGGLHRDRGLAARSALAAVIAISACCAFWIVTAWPSGSGAPMMAAVFCCFFAAQDDPVPTIRLFVNYTLLSIPISAFYLLMVLPAVHDFTMLALVLAPSLLLLGIYAARPATRLQATATLIGVLSMLSLQDTGTGDMISFINGMLAQITGYVAAMFFTRLLRSVSAQWTARRLLRAGWREMALLAEAVRVPSVLEISTRMVDRIALLTPRLAIEDPQQDLSAVDALCDLRVGLNMAQLRNLQPRLANDGVSLQPLMQKLSDHFRRQPGQPAAASAVLLAGLDATLRAACATVAGNERLQAIASLASIRRDLFPLARAYEPLTGVVEGIEMIGEFSLYGIYVPWVLLLSLLSFACTRLLAYLLVRIGFYRLVWHPVLFDLALFIIILGGFTFLLPKQVY